MHASILISALVVAVTLCEPAPAADVLLGKGDEASGWTIAVADPAGKAGDFRIDASDGGWFDYSNTGYERAAADELASLAERMTGLRPEVVTIKDKSEAENHKRLIAIGRLAVDLGATPPKSKYGIDGSIVIVQGDRILLAGETPMASYFAMTRLMDMAGCRWYMPGPLGEIAPRVEALRFATGRYEEVPVVWARQLWLDGGTPGGDAQVRTAFHRWMLHNRQYGMLVPGGHVWEVIIPADKYFKDHPEWFALVNGQRQLPMLCTTNEEMTREFIKNYRKIIDASPGQTWFSISQTDGMDFCECGACRSLDPKLREVTMPNHPRMTDRFVNFYNKVVSELVKDHPDKYFCFLAYVQTTAPPVREKLNPHLMPLIAPITYSRYHAMGAHNSETMQALESYIEEWGKMCPSIGYYPYMFNLGDGLLPYTREHQTRHDMPFLVKNRLGFLCAETVTAWYNLLPYYYLTARLDVDVKLDQDALIDEFYRNFFGPASSDMRAYMDLLGDTYKSFNYEVAAFWATHLIFTPDVMRNLNAHLTSAERKAKGDAAVTERVAMWRFGYRAAELFLQMRKQALACRFDEAARTAGEIESQFKALTTRNPYAASPYAIQYVFTWGWKTPMERCASALRGARILYRFPDEWYTFLDYSQIGEVGGFWRPDFPLTRWTKLKTFSASLGEQKITRFRGVIWYRTGFELPSDAAGKKLRMLFAGVDGGIQMYINGKRVDRSADLPSGMTHNFDVTDYLRSGENTIVCSVNIESPSDIDVGGIMLPVVLYEPASQQTK